MNSIEPSVLVLRKLQFAVTRHCKFSLWTYARACFVAFLWCIICSAISLAQTPVALMYDSSLGGFKFASTDIKAALQQNGFTVTELPLGDPAVVSQTMRIILSTNEISIPGKPVITGLTQQGYAIRKIVNGATTTWWVIGKDSPGAMYGGLELAEAINIANGLNDVTDRTTNPHIANRGIKFNIPLDARSPSYSDDSSSAQANIANMWEQSFWIGFLDNMARHRYNTLSLWNLHPFPSMVRVPEYPNAALADVKQKEGALWNADVYGKQMYDASWQLRTLKTMTIEDKITHWRWVMQYAKDRGIDLYLFTWNIFTYGTEPSGYGITDSFTNTTTKHYFRKSVQAMFNTYPLLAGVGITAGENMEGLSSDQEEQWLWDTYGQGVSDAMADAKNSASPFHAPDRKIRLIHRLHFASPSAIAEKFQSLPGASDADSSLQFSMKYSIAHMHSSTKPLFVQSALNQIPSGNKTFLTVRNDDMYNMRWGDPDFARDYMSNLSMHQNSDKITGFYMGPDGYTWGREYISTEPDAPRQQVIDKMWYSFLLYGRLAYEPSLPNSRFQALLRERFTELSNNDLFEGWQSTSKIIPLINRFFWGPTDYVWYPEACTSAFSGFKSARDFIDGFQPMQSDEDGTGPLFMSVLQYVNGDAANGRLNPLQVADLLQEHAELGMAKTQGLSAGSNKELRLTLGDIKAMASLGRYYADKIRGAVSLARHDKNGLASDYNAAREYLLSASNHWKQYGIAWSSQYNGQVLTRLGNKLIDIVAMQSEVNADIPVPLPSTTPDSLPWVEDFNLPSGFRADGAPTAWQVTRSGDFQISNDGKLFINGNGGEGVFTTNTIDISGGSVNLSLDVVSAGGVDAVSGSTQDYVKLFIKVNGGPEQLVTNVVGPQAVATWTRNGIIGDKLQVIVRTLVGQSSEFYYLDNLKVVRSQPTTLYNLETSSNNGSIILDPPGGVYGANTVVSVRAIPSSASYSFVSWLGSLSGTLNPVNITMDSNKSITANFASVVATPDGVPWFEDFNLPLGTKSQGSPTTWTATRAAGNFQVNSAGQLFINQFGGAGAVGEAVLETGEIDISGALEVRMSLSVQAAGGLDLGADPDYVRFYKIVDGAAPVLIAPEILGGFTGTRILVGNETSGSRLKLKITSKVTANTEFYYFDDLKVEIVRSPKNILFIAGDVSNLSPSDTAIVARLQSKGHTVQAINDEVSTTASAMGKDLVIISSSVGGSQVNTKFQGVAVPIINWETLLQDEFLFTPAPSTTTQGTSATQTAINLINANHPLAGGLAAGARTVAGTAGPFSWGAPGGAPIIIAYLNDGTNRPAIYAYETGAAMNSGTAAARRVNLFLQNDTFVSLNTDGLTLFDAAVDWATGQSSTSPNNAVQSSSTSLFETTFAPYTPDVGDIEYSIVLSEIGAGLLRLEWSGEGLLQKSIDMKEPWVDVPGAISPFEMPISESQEFFRIKR